MHAADRRPAYAITGLVIAVALLWLGNRARTNAAARRTLDYLAAGLHLLFGLAGAILLFLWLATDHVAAHRNENILLLNPLSLLLAPFCLRADALSPRLRRTGNLLATIICLLAVLALLAKTLPDYFIQANLHWILLLLPIHLALLLSWRKGVALLNR
jgi:hypothetical protein